MTRAAEFCYIAEHNAKNTDHVGIYLMGFVGSQARWTIDPEMALRITEAYRSRIVFLIERAAVVDDRPDWLPIGFRKILLG